MERSNGAVVSRPVRNRSKAIAVIVLLVLMLATACGDDDDDEGGGTTTTEAEDSSAQQELLGPENEATGEAVRVGLISDGASDIVDNSAELVAGNITVDYLNKHQGGIAGRPIELVTCETLADPAKASDCANQMVERGVVGVVVDVSNVLLQIWEPLNTAGIPTMFFQASGTELLTDPDTTFVLSNPLGGAVGMPVVTAQEVDGTKVGVILIDVPSGRSAYEGFAPQIFQAHGLELQVVPVPPGTADMTPQARGLLDADPDVVHVLGNDTFCIAAFQALGNVGYDGAISTFSGCVSDATREAVGADVLEGIRVSSASPVGAEGEATFDKFRAVMQAFGEGEDIDLTDTVTMGTYTVVSAFVASLEGITGEITPASVAATIKASSEREMPGGGGMTLNCGGDAIAILPAVCSNEVLVTMLDDEGQPTEYEVVDLTPILSP